MLFTEPLTGLIWRENKLVFVVDGLDEVISSGKNSIIDLVAGQFLELPKWIGFLVTSRPDALVISRLSGFKPFSILPNNEKNIDDLRAFYDLNIASHPSISKLPTQRRNDFKTQLITQSSGMILFLKLVHEGLLEDVLTTDSISELSIGVPGIQRYYFVSFQHRFSSSYDRLARPLLRLVLAAPGPLLPELAKRLLGHTEEEFAMAMACIGSYLVDGIRGLEIFHPTLRDWLTDKLSGQFLIDPTVGERQIADFLWREFMSWDTPGDIPWEKQICEWLPKLLKTTEHWNNFNGLTRLGKFLVEHNYFANAYTILFRAISLGAFTGVRFNNSDSLQLLESFLMMGIRLADWGNLEIVAESIGTLKELSDNELQFVAKLLESYYERRIGNLRNSKQILDALAINLDNTFLRPFELRLKFHSAHLDHLLGLYEEAAKSYEAIVLSPFSSKLERETIAYAKRQLADVSMLRGRFHEALTSFNSLLDFESANPYWRLETMRMKGHVFRFNCNYEESLNIYVEVAHESKRWGMKGMLGKALVNMSEVFCWNNPSHCLEVIDDAFELTQTTGNQIECGKALTAKGIAQVFNRRYEDALLTLNESVRVQNTAGYRSGVLFAEAAKALVYCSIQDTSRTYEVLRVIDDLTRKLGAYRYLTWFYSEICGVPTTINPREFDWLNIEKLRNSIKLAVEKIRSVN